MARGRADLGPQVPFRTKLVVNQWLLKLFGVQRFEELQRHLSDEALEGLDEDNIHHFHHALTAHFPDLPLLPTDLLLEYDQNIVMHTRRLNQRRLTVGDPPIVWKYFQYLTLLFTEIYLDRYFRDPEALLAALNAQLARCNGGLPAGDRLPPFDATAEAWPQLNKLAYWSATGSGKTLLMHANILQYQHLLAKHGRRRELNRILLLTPNEGLSEQHLREFEAAGIAAERFDKSGHGLFAGRAVEILEVTRLRDEMGAKTVAIDAFEGNNLVLVDEGHRGTSGVGGAWMRYRNALCEKGFSFEYSATFGQAVSGRPDLVALYAKSTIFDYSYRYFHGDGYGKDYQILNLGAGTQQDQQEHYLVACLLSFFQQQRLYREQGAAFSPFNIEKPLWVLVGGSVTATLGKREASDIAEILTFLGRYVDDRRASIGRIASVMRQGLVTAGRKNVFARRFAYLASCELTPAQIFEETLATLFNAPGGGQLYVEDLRGVGGEVALRIGSENEAFGVINVGDDAKLLRLCEQHGLATRQRAFAGSLFHGINAPHSRINLLIGAKKFTEGWNSWRVSTMGLMNVGKGEGAQIIQLFGRGVRLKGYDSSLKRSSRRQHLEGAPPPEHIDLLETLAIFGIHADYMAQFRDFLEEEGLPRNEDRGAPVRPVTGRLGTRTAGLINGLSLASGEAFRELAPMPTLSKPDPAHDPDTASLLRSPLVLNWYPKIQALTSRRAAVGEAAAVATPTHLSPCHVAFFDLDRLTFELTHFKAERGWHNLHVTRQGIEVLLADPSWYSLLIPGEALAFDGFEKVRLWEEVALSLLKRYTARYYALRKSAWERPHLEASAQQG